FVEEASSQKIKNNIIATLFNSDGIEAADKIASAAMGSGKGLKIPGSHQRGQSFFHPDHIERRNKMPNKEAIKGHTDFTVSQRIAIMLPHGIIATMKIWRYFLRLPDNDIFGQNTMKRLRNLFHWDISLQKEGSHLACGVNPGIGTAYRQKRNG